MTQSRSDLDAATADVVPAARSASVALDAPTDPDATQARAPRDPHSVAFEPALTYRPYLDGLRCIAVYLVVAFHAGLPGFAGSFIGVDVFFVLSGYLVTRILIRDLLVRDRVDFQRFYARRFRRILPAAAAVLVVAGIVYSIVATPLQVLDVVGGLRACFWYVANWHFVSQSTDYFAPSVAASPVLHFWSLAVEEQFYLLWPLLLGVLYVGARRAGRWRWSVLRVVVLGIALVSLARALRFGAAGLDRAYYGTDTRAYQLLAGALIALTPQLVSTGKSAARAVKRLGRRITAVSLVALVFLGSSFLHMSPITRGAWVVGATGVLIIALERVSNGGVADLLSDRRTAYLGRISYGTYLWHWPIIVLITRDHHVAPVPLFVIAVVASTGLAALSAYLLENPIRRARSLDSRGYVVIAIALCVSLVGGLFISPLMQGISDGRNKVESQSIVAPNIPTRNTATPDWRAARKDIPTYPECLGEPVDHCIIVRGTGKRILLMGDSLAGMWLPAFRAIAERDSLTLAVAIHPACPWLQDIEGISSPKDCGPLRDDWYDRVIPQFDPDVVVLANRPYDAPGNIFGVKVNGHTVSVLNPIGMKEMREKTERTVAGLQRPGRKVVLLEPTPIPADLGYDPMSCVSTGSTHCSFTVSTHPTPLTDLDREIAQSTPRVGSGTAQSGVWSLNLNRLACPRFPVCDPVVNGFIVRRDHTHLTATYVRVLTDPLESMLRRDHII